SLLYTQCQASVFLIVAIDIDKTITIKRDRRSPWRDPTDEYNPVGVKLYQNADAEVKVIAQMIIDLCYNIAVESGIKNISVSYETYERAGDTRNTLSEAEIRVNQCICLLEELEERLKQRTSSKIKSPPWGDALEVIQEAKLADKGKAMEKEPFPPPRKCPKTISAQKKTWKRMLNKAIGMRFGYMLLCAAIFMIVICCIDPRIEPFVRWILNVDTENSIWFLFVLYMAVYLITYALDYVVLKLTKLFDDEENVVQTTKKC
ncbi:MAG: hypothetical protein LUD83_07315, partial [Clostridiales bacterium]|nr:hypothetical protein [Clostridiales bacterium]